MLVETQWKFVKSAKMSQKELNSHRQSDRESKWQSKKDIEEAWLQKFVVYSTLQCNVPNH